MTYKLNKINISKISVIGAGQIGPDIALHFAKTLSSFDVLINVIDISLQALGTAKEKVYKKINKGVAAGVLKSLQADKMKDSLVFSDNYENIRGSQLIIEAATEDENIKDRIFRQVETLTENNCIFLSNSSHMQPEVIFRNINNKSRCLVAHYFFPAEINPVVEIVPGADTDANLTESLLKFYESIGKVPIKVKSSYGYAIDPIFEGICQTAIICLEKGMGTVKEIDEAAVKALGLGVGPFTALNLTGGNPITAHGLDEMGKLVMPWFKTPETLKGKTTNGEKWETAQRGETVTISPEKEAVLIKEFQSSYFALASFILDTGIVDIDDLNMACELSLVIKPPFSFMNKIGIGYVHNCVQSYCFNNPDFHFPEILNKATTDGGWKLSDIKTEIKDNVLLVTIRRPKVLNALNLEGLYQIKNALEEVKIDSNIKAAIITSFGVKAFVSGADLDLLSSLKTPEEGYDNSHNFQTVLNYIENYPKPVICAMNGFALGGGNELAMSCTARIAKKNLPILICQPEVNLGFIPGAGGTQRLPRLIGIEKAAEILRTARTVSSKEALESGYIYKEAENLIEEAIELAFKIANKEINVKPIIKEPFYNGEIPEDIDIGHLSTKIDEIIIKSIYDGAKMRLMQGLDLESRMFGECLNTEDMKIGLENFKTNGPRVKANFINN